MKRSEFKKEVCERIKKLYFVNSRMVNQGTIDWLIDVMAEVIADGLKRDGVFGIRDIIKINVVDNANKRRFYDPYRGEIGEYTPKKRIQVKLGKSIVDKINEGQDDEAH